ncbi:MAG: ABC transporter substrate-binding protein [Nocardiopsaceae bacterium]|jgi:peptide/nickel transport system substrate-binding protein|nr:ABC transporter substrate-binding protein [Nocardiopsaceae bacterium]
MWTKKRQPARLGLAAAAVAVALVAAACGSGGGGGTGGSGSVTGTPKHGGALTVLEGSGFAGQWPAGLDPATNTNGAANQPYMDSIYGQMFELGSKGKIIPDLATGYKFSNGGKTVTISLRHGVNFTDGTPFNADAVVWNIKRDLKSPCTCKPTWPIASIKAIGSDQVQINLATVFAPIIASFIDSTADWIASPTAVKKLGEKQFRLHPVGAGPFMVASNTPNSVLVLKRNPHYWQPGRPYLDKLTFKSVGSDEAAYEAMLAGEGQVYEDMSTPDLLKQAAQHFHVQNQLSTSPYDLQFNTAIPPFNNIKARLAIYYATDFRPILQHIFHNLYPMTQSFTAPGGICYQQQVPGYPAYNLAKAKALVKQIGGLNVQLGTINVLVAKETTQALQTEWAKAGIKTTIHSWDLGPLIQQFTGGKWQAMIQTAGAYDPAVGVGVGFRFNSKSPFSGVHDPHLDSLLGQAAGTLDMGQRCKLYGQAAQYIAQKAYGPFYFSFAPANIAAKNVVGPGLTSPLSSVVVTPNVPYEDVALTS